MLDGVAGTIIPFRDNLMTTISPRPTPAASAVIVENGSILLVKRGCEPNKDLWSLPGGCIELGETAREAAAREVLEETSLVVEVGDVADVRDVVVKDADGIKFHYVIINFHARAVSGDVWAASDAADARWVPLREVESYPTTPGLTDRLASLGLL